ncbi:hypothetical protein A9Q84_14345 [Halobacteriovorax marinus]|uniref:Uncharacterized protein n=1 Tax=Halobacteriovorax marinus TaxID=97084 RepID=A0A1Y5F547_9BACT|nr:hypothetical protein A9Q84_14345 [Halobacteriovorax marinus]
MKKQKYSSEKLYIQFKPYMMSVAFRMLGNLAEAEEIVHDTFLEYEKASISDIINHKAWLTKVCSNKAINYLKSAYKRREVYPGIWLPDEVPESLQAWDNLSREISPEEQTVLAESLTTSFLLLIEKLSPEQRVVYLLNEVFDYSFKEISEFLNKEVPTCRKVAQRARAAISSEKKNFSPPPINAEEIIIKFYEHVKSGDREALKAILSKDSEIWGDGGGKVFAAGHITDLEETITFFERLGATKIFHSNLYKMEYCKVNSRPGIIFSKKEDSGLWTFDTIMSYEFHGSKIARIYAQRNPEKLKTLLSKF